MLFGPAEASDRLVYISALGIYTISCGPTAIVTDGIQARDNSAPAPSYLRSSPARKLLGNERPSGFVSGVFDPAVVHLERRLCWGETTCSTWA